MQEANEWMSMTSTTIGKDLLGAFVTEMKLMPDVWAKMSEVKQNDVLDRIRKRVEDNVRMAVHLLSSQGGTVVAGDIDQITIKDGVKAIVKFDATAENLHELYESNGKRVLIVVANPAEHLGGTDEIKGESDQRAMDLGHEYHDNDGGGMDGYKSSDVIDAIAIENKPLQSEIDARLAYRIQQEGARSAREGMDIDACPHELESHASIWVEGWILHWKTALYSGKNARTEALLVAYHTGFNHFGKITKNPFGDTEQQDWDELATELEKEWARGVLEGMAAAENNQYALDQAHDKGHMAAKNGEPESSCPFENMALRNQWRMGWRNFINSIDSLTPHATIGFFSSPPETPSKSKLPPKSRAPRKNKK